MSEPISPEPPSLTIPFRVREHDGQVSVFYTVNSNPARLGFELLELPFPLSRIEGFPVCRAEVLYAGEGYNRLMGWIQVITVTEANGSQWASVDVAPIFWEDDSPFAAFGYLPTLFDAPGPNPPRSDETWVAETFLVIVPDIAKTRRVTPVLGFRWGYELRSSRPQPLPATAVGEAEWQRCLDALTSRYLSWDFTARFER